MYLIILTAFFIRLIELQSDMKSVWYINNPYSFQDIQNYKAKEEYKIAALNFFSKFYCIVVFYVCSAQEKLYFQNVLEVRNYLKYLCASYEKYTQGLKSSRCISYLACVRFASNFLSIY